MNIPGARPVDGGQAPQRTARHDAARPAIDCSPAV